MKGVAGYDGEDESSDDRSDLRAETIRGNSIYALLLEYGKRYFPPFTTCQ